MDNKNDLVTKVYLDESFEKFAVIINGAFAAQQRYMDGRFERIENRLDKVEYKVDVLQDQMELVNKRQVKTEKRIEKLEIATI
ncbi:MAG: hypothetical protein AAB610_03345 [Patescibacteria group bacterium]